MKITVKPNKKVLVSFPFFVSEKEILSFLAQNEDWIRRQQDKAGKKNTFIEEGSVINTKLHTVHFLSGNQFKIEPEKNFIRFYSSDYQDEQTQLAIEELLTRIYKIEAHKLLPPRLAELAQKHGFCYSKVSVRNNRRNWGSCSSRNNISLNLQMMKLPDNLIDYILLHELVHTEIKNHSEKFWEKLDQLTQNQARDLAKEIKKYSTYSY